MKHIIVLALLVLAACTPVVLHGAPKNGTETKIETVITKQAAK